MADPKDAKEPMLPLHMATNTAAAPPREALERDGGPSRDAPSLVRHADHFYEGTWVPFHRPDETLPPHFGERMVLKHPCSPYPVTMDAFARLFGASPERSELLRGLLDFRRDLRAIGVDRGFHWIGGSLVEKSAKPPSDVDVVTFFVAPERWSDAATREAVLRDNPALFDKELAKARYRVDAYLIQLALKRDMFRHLTLWSALFGHDRATNAWKGFCEIDLDAPDGDAAARAVLG